MKITGYETPIKIVGGIVNALIFVLLGMLLVLTNEIHKESKLQTAWAAQCDAIKEFK